MASYDLLPTVEMEHPKAGRCVVTDEEKMIAEYTERGYKIIPGTRKGARVTIVEQDVPGGGTGQILDAIGQPAIQVAGTDENDTGGNLEPTTEEPEAKTGLKVDKKGKNGKK